MIAHIPAAALFLAMAAATPAQAASDPQDLPPVAWRDLLPHVRESLATVREEGRWSLSPLEAGPGNDLPAVVRSAVQAARDDLAWLAGEILTGLRAGAGEGGEGVPGSPSPLDAAEVEALLAEGAFADPLKLFIDAALRARGSSCSDCLEALRPSRGASWRQVLDHVRAFIYIEAVDPDGRILLRVGRNESALPPLEECDRDLAAAVYALVQELIREAPVFTQAVQGALNEEVLLLGETPPEEARERLNRRVPDLALGSLVLRGEILLRLPGILDRHRLRCTDCPEFRAVPRETGAGQPRE